MYEKTEEGWLIELPPEDQMGPAMRRLNERQRRYVCALSVFGGDQSRAYVFAGYNTKTPHATAVSASRLANSDDIKEAIKEEAWRRLDYSSVLAISTMLELASPSNPDKAIRLKAADMLSKRTGFHEKTEHLVVHEDRRTTKELIEFISGMTKKLGLEHQVALPVIDVTAEVVSVPSADGIEDLL